MKKLLINGLLLGSSLTMLVWSTPGLSQDAAKPPVSPAAPAANTPTVTRAYDVQDLLLIVKNYPLGGSLIPPTKMNDPAARETGGGGGGGEQGLFQQSQPASPTNAMPIDQLKALIIGTVQPGSWKDSGGTIGSIAVLNDQLFVTQTAENQTAVATLLEEVRKGRAQMVRVRADWVVLSPGQIDKLLKNGGADTAALPEVSRDILSKLPEGTPHYTGQIACFSGQTVHIASGRAKNVITTVTPVVAPSAVAMDPTVAYVHYGVSLEVMPTLSTDSATLDLSSVVSDGNSATRLPATQPALPEVDRVNNVVQNFHTTVQVPLNKPVLVGGTTADPGGDQASGKEMYLIIEADGGK